MAPRKIGENDVGCKWRRRSEEDEEELQWGIRDSALQNSLDDDGEMSNTYKTLLKYIYQSFFTLKKKILHNRAIVVEFIISVSYEYSLAAFDITVRVFLVELLKIIFLN